MMIVSLTPRANDLLGFIKAFLDANGGVAPTRRQMANGIGEKSVSGAQRLLDQLVERGFVERLPNRHRAIEVIRSRPVALPPDLHLEAHAAASRRKTTVNALVADAVRCWLDTE